MPVTTRRSAGLIHRSGARHHVRYEGQGRPLRLHLTKGQRSGDTDAEALAADLPPADILLAGCACSSRWFREVLADKGIAASVRPNPTHKHKPRYDPLL